MTKKSWAPSDVKLLKQAVADKVSMAVIAVMLDRDEMSVAFKAQSLGLERALPV